MKLNISDAFTLLADPYTEYINIYTMLENNGNIRLTIETSTGIENAQNICLVLSGKQASTIASLINTALESSPNVVKNVDEVE